MFFLVRKLPFLKIINLKLTLVNHNTKFITVPRIVGEYLVSVLRGRTLFPAAVSEQYKRFTICKKSETLHRLCFVRQKLTFFR